MDAARDLHAPRRRSPAAAVRAAIGPAVSVPAAGIAPLLRLADGAGRARVLDRLQRYAGNAAVQRLVQAGMGLPTGAPLALQRCGGERHQGCEQCS